MQAKHKLFFLFVSLTALALVAPLHAAAPVPPARTATEAQAGAADPIPDTLEQRLLACAVCHGKQGEGIAKSEYYPRLAGKPAGYLYNQLRNFRELRREVPIMTYMVAYMSDGYLHEIAEHYSQLQPPYPAPATGFSDQELARGEALVRKGDAGKNIPACSACHGKSLTGMEPTIPGLIGLNREYIVAQLGAWKTGQRHAARPDCMAQIANRLSPQDVSAVSAYLTTQRATANPMPALARSAKLPLDCGVVPGASSAVPESSSAVPSASGGDNAGKDVKDRKEPGS
ncbi:MAG: c-type cytochrome [Burkholderiales bacterium]|nr:c-type cytochrome [Burkholderiales bacterium]